MSVLVHKYGGTSMRDTQRILANASRVVADLEAGHQVAVVVSAMSGETNRLLGLADEIDPAGSGRERDMLASAGEQVSIALMAMAVHKLGHDAVSFTAPQAGIRTDEVHTRARIRSIDTKRLKGEMNAGKVVIVAGFQGVTEANEITTLGRGASDTTAAAVAAALEAERCLIYTDVNGIYTADPRIVPRAKLLRHLSYDETLEMASAGAKVLHARSVLFAKKYRVPLLVRNSFTDDEGTLITEEVPAMEDVVVSAVPYSRNEARISMLGVPDQPGVAANIFNELADQGINVDMIIQNVGAEGGTADLSFTVERAALADAEKASRVIADNLKAREISINKQIAKVSVVGVGMRSHSGIASRMFKTLADKGINILMISTSEIKISVVIEEDYTELAVRALCDEFDLTEAEEE